MTDKPRPKLLIVDDGDRHVELAHRYLRQYSYATRCELSGPCWTCKLRRGCTLTHAHDLRELDEALALHPDLDGILLDVAFDLPAARLAPSREPSLVRRQRFQGLELLAHIRRVRGPVPVVLMTSLEELGDEDALAVLDADEYVALAGAEAFDARALGLLVERVLANSQAAPSTDAYRFGRSTAMTRLRRDALVLARTSLPLLLLGETGTGKSALAEHVLHAASRRSGPFVSIDLSALPEALVAAELFGSARGAYSGAVDRAGHLERARGGTLFLDEIGNLTPELQRMLLVALESGRVTRLGETTPRPVDVKLVCATNADLRAAVRAGSFRADLYARLNPAAALTLPPLRARAVDLEELLASFVRRAFSRPADRALLDDYCAAAGIEKRERDEMQGAVLLLGRAPSPPLTGVGFALSPQSQAALRRHDWPGNLRELEQLVSTACALSLADATRAAEAGRADPASSRLIPLPTKLLSQLLSGGAAVGDSRSASGGATAPRSRLRPGRTLHEVARTLERELYERLYSDEAGDFSAIARRLLEGNVAKNARRVRLRYYQLGLRVRPDPSHKK